MPNMPKDGEIITETGEHVSTVYKGVELSEEDDNDQMKALIDEVTKNPPTVIDIKPEDASTEKH